VTPDNAMASVTPLQQSTKLTRGTLKERVGQPGTTDRVSGLWEGKTGGKGREGRKRRLTSTFSYQLCSRRKQIFSYIERVHRTYVTVANQSTVHRTNPARKEIF
jgi:hypothetical protein